MSGEMQFVPYEWAKKIVGNVIEEEHLHEENRRILTVYDIHGKEMCWFDAEEVLAEVTPEIRDKEEIKIAAVERILQQIPKWAVDEKLLRTFSP